jgi:predicted alternative tryptophan synthase beta-subunit
MVRISYNQKPYRKMLMQTRGADCAASPSPDTEAGRKFLSQDAEHPGTLGIAISEAVEDAATSKETRYSLGSALNHVLMHQTVVGLEAQEQMARTGEYPDVVIACVIEEAKKAKEEGKERVILMNFSGHGLIDLGAYDAFLSGKLQDTALGDEDVQKLLRDLEKCPRP